MRADDVGSGGHRLAAEAIQTPNMEAMGLARALTTSPTPRAVAALNISTPCRLSVGEFYSPPVAGIDVAPEFRTVVEESHFCFRINELLHAMVTLSHLLVLDPRPISGVLLFGIGFIC